MIRRIRVIRVLLIHTLLQKVVKNELPK